MSYRRYLVFIFLWSSVAFSEEHLINQNLYKLYQEDQSDRKNRVISRSRDNERLKAVQEMINTGKVITADDYYHAALIFQHGSKPKHFEKAKKLAQYAVKLKPDFMRAKWLSCAAEDRYLHSVGKPQVWGTQRIGVSFLTLEPFDEHAKTDAQRASCGIPPLAVIKKRLKKANAK